MSRNARAKRESRKHKVEKEEGQPQQAEKFTVQYKKNVPAIRPLNDKQTNYMYSINGNPLTIATGYAGTSKTYLPTAIACDMLKLKQIEKIILTRPNVSDSKSLGFFGGDLNEKMKNWLLPVLDVMVERLGAGMVDYCIAKGKIEFVPLEVIKGRSFNEAFIIADEAEDLTYAEVKKIITRLGQNSKMVLAGDITQKDLRCESGLSIALEMAKNNPDLNCGWVDFDSPSDIVRSETVKKWILGFNKYEGVR
tara:strand:- start:6021 stop:6773 length:753 start_codon:yes stop_codon:yes gene_type:complete